MRNSERGFTLIETLVALVIAIVSGVLFFQSFVSGTRTARVADRHEVALLIARSRLAEIGFESPLATGEQTGITADGISWRTTVKPYASEDNVQIVTSAEAFWATVTVSWRDKRTRKQRSLKLTTLKLGTNQ